MASGNPEGRWELEYFSSVCTQQNQEYGVFSLVNECYQHCDVCFLWKGNPCWVISEAVMKLLLAQIIDAHWGSSSAGLWSALCVNFAVSWFCSDFAMSALINFRLDGLLSDSWRAVSGLCKLNLLYHRWGRVKWRRYRGISTQGQSCASLEEQETYLSLRKPR